MKKVKATAVISLFAGYFSAQAQETQFKGMLVDSCRSSYTDSQKSTRNNNRDTNTTKSLEKQFANNSTSHPGTVTTALYGLITEDGKCISFDLGSSEKVSGLMKIKTDWSENTMNIKPTKVEVVGTVNNDNTIAVDEIKIK